MRLIATALTFLMLSTIAAVVKAQDTPTDAKTEVNRPPDLAKDDPLEPLNRRVGAWVTKEYLKKAVWTPEAQTNTGVETIKWVLDKKLIQGDVIFPDGKKLVG